MKEFLTVRKAADSSQGVYMYDFDNIERARTNAILLQKDYPSQQVFVYGPIEKVVPVRTPEWTTEKI